MIFRVLNRCKVKTIALSLAVIFTACFFTGCSDQTIAQGGEQTVKVKEEDTFNKIKREGILRVGYIPAAPWCIRDAETGKLSGTFVDAILEIVKDMDTKVEFVEADFSTFIAGLQSKKWRCKAVCVNGLGLGVRFQ